MQQTKISLIRSDSRGLVGTHKNANCHAQAILPYIKQMEHAVDKLGFANWLQGNNVHEFTTTEGTRYTLRPFLRDGGYSGVRLALRLSRSQEIRLIDIDTPDDTWRLLDMMRMLAQPAKGEKSGVMIASKAA